MVKQLFSVFLVNVHFAVSFGLLHLLVLADRQDSCFQEKGENLSTCLEMLLLVLLRSSVGVSLADICINTVATTWCEAPAQLLIVSACWVFLCFRNLTNSDMDYRIFNMHTWSFLCAHYTRGVGTSTASQHNISDSEELTNCSCAPDGIRTFILRILNPTLYQLSHPVTPSGLQLTWKLILCRSGLAQDKFTPIFAHSLWTELSEGLSVSCFV